ncbi:MAG: hypothetical protein WAQ52_06585 [Terriglobales bacterium]
MVELIKESAEDRESRLLLIRLLQVSEQTLDRYLHELAQLQADLQVQFHELTRIWRTARANLRGVIDSIRIGLSLIRRQALIQVGMFGDTLAAKFSLLALDIQEGAVKRVLKRLNSMFGSLAKVFPALHAVKELKDHAEATMDGMKQPLEFISLKDLLEQQ